MAHFLIESIFGSGDRIVSTVSKEGAVCPLVCMNSNCVKNQSLHGKQCLPEMTGKQNQTRYNLLNTDTAFAASVFLENLVKTKQAFQTKYFKINTKYVHVH